MDGNDVENISKCPVVGSPRSHGRRNSKRGARSLNDGGRTAEPQAACHQNTIDSNPLGPDFNYCFEEVSRRNWTSRRVKADLHALMDRFAGLVARRLRHYGPSSSRMAWHAAGTLAVRRMAVAGPSTGTPAFFAPPQQAAG